jgi:hypothetical protein
MITEKRNSAEIQESKVNLLQNLKSLSNNELKQLFEDLNELNLNKNYHKNLLALPNQKLRMSSFRKVNENRINQITVQPEETTNDKSEEKSKTSGFIRNLSLKFKSSTKLRRHTTCLCEMNKNISIKKANFDSSICSNSSTSNKPISSSDSIFLKEPPLINYEKCSKVIENEKKKLKDCQHFNDKLHVDETSSGL